MDCATKHAKRIPSYCFDSSEMLLIENWSFVTFIGDHVQEMYCCETSNTIVKKKLVLKEDIISLKYIYIVDICVHKIKIKIFLPICTFFMNM